MIKQWLFEIRFRCCMRQYEKKPTLGLLYYMLTLIPQDRLKRYSPGLGASIKMRCHFSDAVKLTQRIGKTSRDIQEDTYIQHKRDRDPVVITLDDFLTDDSNYPLNFDDATARIIERTKTLADALNKCTEESKKNYYRRQINYLELDILEYLKGLYLVTKSE